MLPTQLLPHPPTPDSGFGLRAYFGLRRRVQASRRVSSDSLFGLGLALPQQLVQNDDAEGGYTDTPDTEVADGQQEIDIVVGHTDHTRPYSQTHGGGYQVAALGEVDSILYPDATTGGRNQAEKNDSQPPEYAGRNGGNQRTELRAEPQENRDKCRDNEDRSRIDAGHGHHPYVFCVRRQTSPPA